MLAKSNGMSLELHSKCVAKIATELSKQLLPEDFLSENLEKIQISALIHDIGKCLEGIQKYFKSFNAQDVQESDEMELGTIHHHEASWAIAMCLFDKSKFEYALNAIYWHHAKPIYDKETKESDYISNILNKISESEIEEIYKNLSILIPKALIPFEQFINNIKSFKESGEKTPSYYSPTESRSNQHSILYRTILISSDRISSSLSIRENELVLSDDNFCKSLLENSKKLLTASIPSFYDKERVNLQIEIAKQCDENKTTIVKAPAGFGKTLVGLLWTLNRENKLLWVCPRNVVVESVYDSILSEINSLGLNGKISVELFVTGNRKQSTNPDLKVFQSDIVVTNIDNFLAPVSKNRFGIWGVEILKRDVVFDEFHEFITESALFSGFVEIMKIRNSIVKCNTVLLSATNFMFNFLWDTPIKKTKILPNNEEHYPAAHSKSYKVEFVHENELVNKKNSLIITNSIFNAQLKKKNLNMDLLVHSDFLEEDKNEIFAVLFENYKKGSTNENKPSVASAPIIQASMDVSFHDISKSSLSPEADVQAIGRCNRWGEYDDSTIRFFRIETERKSERKAIKVLYDLNLNDIWYDFLQKEIESYNYKITLNDLYKIYNKFNKTHEEQIKAFVRGKYKSSLNSLSNIEPVKYGIGSGSKKVSIAVASMRTNGDSIFITYRRHDNRDEFIDPFSINVPTDMPREVYFDEDEDFARNLNKTIRDFIQSGRFKYPKSFKTKVRASVLYKFAYRKDSPYVAFNKEYSKEYGLAKLSVYL